MENAERTIIGECKGCGSLIWSDQMLSCPHSRKTKKLSWYEPLEHEDCGTWPRKSEKDYDWIKLSETDSMTVSYGVTPFKEAEKLNAPAHHWTI